MKSNSYFSTDMSRNIVQKNSKSNKVIWRVVAFACVAILILSMPLSAFAAETDPSQKSITSDDGALALVNPLNFGSNSGIRAATIPGNSKATYTISGTTLTIGGSGAIPSNAFAANSSIGKKVKLGNITRIVVGSGITEIGTYAFTGCIKVSSVTLNEGLKTIRIGAFANCPNLKTVTIPKSVNHIQDGAFRKTCTLNRKNSALAAYGTYGYKTNDVLKFTYVRDYAKAYDLLEKINAARSAKKLSTLKMNASLLEVAMVRGAENVVLFSQFRPNGEEGATIYGRIAGEINAAGGATATSAYNSIIKNSTNQKLIYNGNYQSVGIGCVQYNGIHYWAICFGDSNVKTALNTGQPANKTVTEAVEFPYGTNKITVDGKSYTHNFKIDIGNIKLNSGATKQANLKLGNITFLKSSVKWTSENSNIAKVSSTGVITAVSPGTTKIWAGSSKTPKRAYITVTVNYGTGLYKVNGKWQYYSGGAFKKGTGMVQRPDNGKWYYVKNGIFTKLTTLTKKVVNDGKWYYVQNGEFKNATGMVKRADNNKWYYVKNGVYTKETTLTKKVQSDGKWYYVEKGAFKNATGLVKNTSNNKWYYVQKGVYNNKYTGLCKRVSDGKLFYVKNGAYYKYTGYVTYNGKRYYVRNGAAV